MAPREASTEKSLIHCADLVRARDEDRWLSANYAPAPARARLHAIYAVMSEIAQVQARVSEAPLGEIRFQWWREALDEVFAGGAPRPHPVIEAVAAVSPAAGTREMFEAAIDAHARRLYEPSFADAETLEAWCDAIDGRLAMAAAQTLADLDEIAAAALRKAGAAFAMARLGRLLAPGRETEVAARARALHAEARAQLGRIPAVLMPAAAHFALAPRYLGSQPPGGVERRLAIFGAVATGRI